MRNRVNGIHFNQGENWQAVLKYGKYLALQCSRFVLIIMFLVAALFNSCFAQLLVIANKAFPVNQLTSHSLLALYTYNNHLNDINVTTVEQSNIDINSVFYNALGVNDAYINRTRAQAQFSAPLGFNAPLVLNSAQAVLDAVAKHRNYIGYIIVSPEQLLPDDVKIIYQAPTSTNMYQTINAPKTNNHLQSGDICYLENGKKVCLS
ncbi:MULTISPECIES: hypothetical protein [Cysteiniphilum]|uniref:hypothetical protein n=1 Tax=Cysteiniphilum TaxID=2056696 RepID=UPI00177ADB36|nr:MULTISPECIES: hypothetical protein [Cysteiniphilum]